MNKKKLKSTRKSAAVAEKSNANSKIKSATNRRKTAGGLKRSEEKQTSKPQARTKPKRTTRNTSASRYSTRSAANAEGMRILSIDVGGTKAKMLLSGELESRKVRSGIEFTPLMLVEQVELLTQDWKFDAISIGFPGLVGANGPLSEPGNLGSGWVGFDYGAAFGKPVKFVNDAAMQAVGSYEGGRMIFLGLGTGVGSAMIVDHAILPMELGNMRWDSRNTVGDVLSKRAIKKIGLKKWRRAVHDFVIRLIHSFNADYVVVGGGNAKLVKTLPAGARLGHNQTAFLGGFRLWGIDEYNPNPANSESLPGNWSLI